MDEVRWQPLPFEPDYFYLVSPSEWSYLRSIKQARSRLRRSPPYPDELRMPARLGVADATQAFAGFLQESHQPHCAEHFRLQTQALVHPDQDDRTTYGSLLWKSYGRHGGAWHGPLWRLTCRQDIAVCQTLPGLHYVELFRRPGLCNFSVRQAVVDSLPWTSGLSICRGCSSLELDWIAEILETDWLNELGLWCQQRNPVQVLRQLFGTLQKPLTLLDEVRITCPPRHMPAPPITKEAQMRQDQEIVELRGRLPGLQNVHCLRINGQSV